MSNQTFIMNISSILFDRLHFTNTFEVRMINIELTSCPHGPRRISRWKM